MNNYYTITRKNQLRSFKYGVIVAAYLFVGFVFGVLYTEGEMIDRLRAISIAGLIFSVFYIPVIILHFAYYKYNKSTSLTLDRDKIIINHRGIQYEYDRPDLLAASKFVHVYYKYGFRPAPWSNYGYIKLEFRDGKMFFITSLMIDVNKANFYPFLTYYVGLPLFDKSKYSSRVAQEAKIEKKIISTDVKKFKERFEEYSTEELQEKIDDAKRYEEAAIIAAKEILAERSLA